MLFYGLTIAFAALAGLLAGLGPWFWLGLIAFGLHLAGQIARLDIDDPALCLHLFKSNRDAGLICSRRYCWAVCSKPILN